MAKEVTDRFLDNMRSLAYHKYAMNPYMAPAPTVHTRDIVIDVFEAADYVGIECDIPGVQKNDIHIEASENEIEISVHKAGSGSSAGVKYVFTERNPFSSRVVTLPDGVDGNKCTAAYESGVLKLKIPKPESTVVSKKAGQRKRGGTA